MREILFRGKRLDNGEWVEGNALIPHPSFGGETVIITQDAPFHSLVYTVNPETVGQFTGLTDKNGKKIFDGDIVDALDIFGYPDGYGIVNWNETFNGWYMGKSSMYCNRICTYEVVGNIHDNPELLGGNANE